MSPVLGPEKVENSQVEVTTATVGDDDYTLFVGGSRLECAVADDSADGVGSVSTTCIYSWDGTFTALPAACLPGLWDPSSLTPARAQRLQLSA